MPMLEKLEERVIAAAKRCVAESDFPLAGTFPPIHLDCPRDAVHGDLTLYAAMDLAQQVGKSPLEIAPVLKPYLEAIPEIAEVEIAGAGYINLRLAPAFWRQALGEILDAPTPEVQTAPVSPPRFSHEDPVFVVQYAHARCASILRYAAENGQGADFSAATLAQSPLVPIKPGAAFDLVRLMANWPRIRRTASARAEPNRIMLFLVDLAGAFDRFWDMGHDDAAMRFIQPREPDKTRLNLCLVRAVQIVLAKGMGALGITATEELRNDQTTAT